ncbi:HNH endonuclease signature motif containing protein [Vreelandella titanicae]|uniref:HNH endonuclease signature motif containing protein n=1 Tax=Vreelandella titanicae TaxID=664683 RepID=UPI00315A5437
MVYERERPYMPAEVRRQVMTEAGHCCIVQHCNEHIVEIHHIDENRENNDPSNLAVLCDKHHKLAHNKAISRMDLRKYKELLSAPRHPAPVSCSDHDKKLLKEINEIFSYETILLIKNEQFGKFVREEVINPFYMLFHRSEDPLFKFTDQKLESLRLEVLKKGQKLIHHFGQQSAGLVGGYEYIDISEVRWTHPEMVDHWVKYSSDTVDLAQDFCDSMLRLRAELINYGT